MTPPVFTLEEHAARRMHRLLCDTIIVPAREDGFQEYFINRMQWHAVRLGPEMRDRIKYIAAYRLRPLSAVTHIAAIAAIKPYKNTGKYLIEFSGPATEIGHVPLRQKGKGLRGAVYAQRAKLLSVKTLEEVLSSTCATK